ncbi:hypothetical protein PG993_002996 [Apiospora rasikravindrae]|uniref:Uncharacterized protein n=1 Tax=Apiospora rasikravindrae TaxID=990691 RepID=A0ABR1TY92_9PEZI
MQSANVLVLSPALPSELLTYILDHHVYPTTLIICSSRAVFLEALTNETTQHQQPTPDNGSTLEEANIDNQDTLISGGSQTQQHHYQQQIPPRPPPPPDPNIRLLSSPLYQLSISRHIRTIYTPTVTHLRSYLAVFSPDSSSNPITSPPSSFRSPTVRRPPHLILYGLVALHRDTSEWSAQGLGTTCAVVAETGRRLGWRVEVADPPGSSPPPDQSPHDHDHDHDHALSDETHRDGGRRDTVRGEESLQELLGEKLPILSGGVPLRPGLSDADEGGGWSGRAVEVGRVLSRWCYFAKGVWDEELKDQGV